MKKFILLTSLAIISLFNLHAESDSLLAQYPLISTGIDTSGNNVEMLIINAPFQNSSIYSNGIYFGNDTTGSLIQTPGINNFNFDEFTVSIEFKIESYPSFRNPIIMGGSSWRWIGAYIQDEHLAFLANDFSNYEITDEVVELDKWNILSLSYNKGLKRAAMYFNGKLVYTGMIPLIEHHNDNNFSNQHAGVGETFKGYWRNMRIFNSSWPTGVEENSVLDQIEVIVRPNQLNIVLPPDEKEVSLQIVDMSGKQVGNYRLKNASNNINTSFIKTANYLLVFTNGKGEKAVQKIHIDN